MADDQQIPQRAFIDFNTIGSGLYTRVTMTANAPANLALVMNEESIVSVTNDQFYGSQVLTIHNMDNNPGTVYRRARSIGGDLTFGKWGSNHAIPEAPETITPFNQVRVFVEIKPKPSEMARLLWAMDDNEQAEMFHELGMIASEYTIMVQFMDCRDVCEDRFRADATDEALATFQTMFSSAYKYMGR